MNLVSLLNLKILVGIDRKLEGALSPFAVYAMPFIGGLSWNRQEARRSIKPATLRKAVPCAKRVVGIDRKLEGALSPNTGQ